MSGRTKEIWHPWMARLHPGMVSHMEAWASRHTADAHAFLLAHRSTPTEQLEPKQRATAALTKAAELHHTQGTLLSSQPELLDISISVIKALCIILACKNDSA